MDSKHASKIRKLFTRIDGESIALDGKSKQSVLKKLNYRKISSNQIGSVETTYAYSIRGKAFIRQDNRKINLQIAKRDKTLTIGWPVILGSY